MFWDLLRGDIRHTLRLALKTPVFTTLTVLALALGIGATTAIFAVVNGVLLRSLPYRDDSRLVNVWSDNTSEHRPRNPLSPANFLDFQKLNTTLEGLEGYFTFVTPMLLQGDSGAETDRTYLSGASDSRSSSSASITSAAGGKTDERIPYCSTSRANSFVSKRAMSTTAAPTRNANSTL